MVKLIVEGEDEKKKVSEGLFVAGFVMNMDDSNDETCEITMKTFLSGKSKTRHALTCMSCFCVDFLIAFLGKENIDTAMYYFINTLVTTKDFKIKHQEGVTNE